MASPDAAAPVRISKIAGRYLVFDPDAVAKLRRRDNMNGTLVGTVPQQPTQNIFMGLPIELRPEEAEALVHSHAAYIVDDVAAHMATLRSSDPNARSAYIASLRRRKQAAQNVYTELQAQKAAVVAQHISRSKASKPKKQASSSAPDDEILSSPNPATAAEPPSSQTGAVSFGVTPTSSSDLISQETAAQFTVGEPPQGPLCRFLHGTGYYMTPGLRFGSRYSVYPGDPLRFHAHFMANQYDWHEEIPVLDLVGGGRLATAVKKAFLIGGQQPGADPSQEGPVRSFSIEWASM